MSQLTLATVMFGVFSLAFFWFTLKWNWLPDDLLPSNLTQESTGLFDALGGWALGFAGALVAIRIAGLATNIQQNDSIREEIIYLNRSVEKISDINSKVTRSIYDAKRACTALLLEYDDISKAKPARLINYYGERPAPKSSELSPEVLSNLISKLDDLISTIEESSRDFVFRSLFKFARSPKSDNHIVSPEDAPLDDFFLEESTRNIMLGIVAEDLKVYDFIEQLNRSSKNLGLGISHLRSKNILVEYSKDLEQLLKLVRTDKLEYSGAAWLLLGMFLLHDKVEKAGGKRVYNTGFLLISLVLGSLPNRELLKEYLQSQLEEGSMEYTRSGKQRLKEEVIKLSEQLYYLEGVEAFDHADESKSNPSDLADVINLFQTCANNIDILRVRSRVTGLNEKYNESSLNAKSIDKANNAPTSEPKKG
ncbi:hypothetical protein [Marinomonas algarum]|uniref:hypothetical protein n=1 Tax=Marinomonas algarum TaxID=2883105 RepID=UPI001CFF640C|nr:hypothetical protein [Marinomonas algarum]